MDKHGKLMATAVDSAFKRQCSVRTRQCDILEREVEVQEHYEKLDQANLMMCNALLEIAKAIFTLENDDNFQLEEVVKVDAQGTGWSQRWGFGQDEVSRDNLVAIKQAIVGGVFGASLRTHKAQGIVITEARLQRQAAGVGEATTSGVRAPIILVGGGGRLDKAVIGAVQPRQAHPSQQARGSSTAITSPPQKKVDAGGRSPHFCKRSRGSAEPPSMFIMPTNDVPLFKIDDPAQREPTLRRACIVEKLVMRTIHRRIFKSSSRSNGFTRAESYITVNYATDVARAVWQGLEWSRVVSPSLIYYTLHLKMDMPMWFVGVKIVDRPEDDDLAAQQEATVLHVVETGQMRFGAVHGRTAAD
ncbi:hypothetical protein CBR_g37190 [Chara braunii]|uniref:Uncharacterized protein n=1 Tax=Chara braunii TaxID=69332 RepID=A0A388LMD6_CHABU|nr:hypothetical protein CBR_g37190 [Chara braunii]|eukprot:GBG83478.1 hypothetical protein CBR_g37190 [Chara braunii]